MAFPENPNKKDDYPLHVLDGGFSCFLDGDAGILSNVKLESLWVRKMLFPSKLQYPVFKWAKAQAKSQFWI